MSSVCMDISHVKDCNCIGGVHLYGIVRNAMSLFFCSARTLRQNTQASCKHMHAYTFMQASKDLLLQRLLLTSVYHFFTPLLSSKTRASCLVLCFQPCMCWCFALTWLCCSSVHHALCSYAGPCPSYQQLDLGYIEMAWTSTWCTAASSLGDLAVGTWCSEE